MTEKRYIVMGATGLELGPDWAEVMAEGDQAMAEVMAALDAEERAVREWDRTHCSVCGAAWADEPEHCR